MKAAGSTIGWSLSTVAVIAAAALTAAITNQMPASAATQATYYVAPTGNDSQPGNDHVAVQRPCSTRGTSFARSTRT